MVNLIEFKSWLIDKKGYGKKSTKDIISRVKRTQNWISLPDLVTTHTIFELEQADKFHQLPVSVRSQLKKSLKLVIEFQSINR